MSERLRSWSRKPMGSARAGSNPVAVDIFEVGPLPSVGIEALRGALVKGSLAERSKAPASGAGP